MRDVVRATFPVVPGLDASGVVDEVGAGVVGVVVGDEVFGLGSATTAEFALLDGWARKPASMTWAEAAACALASETAQRGLEDLRVGRAPSCSSRAPPAVWDPRPCSWPGRSGRP